MKDIEKLAKSGFLLLLIAGAFAAVKLVGWLSWSWGRVDAPLSMLGAGECGIKQEVIQ